MGNAHTHGDARATQHLVSNTTPERIQFSHPVQIGEHLVDAVHLHRRYHGFDQAHDPFAHIAIQRVVGGEGHDAVLLERVLDLEIRCAHFDEGLGVVAVGDHAAVVVAQNHNRGSGQVWAEHAFATSVETIAINQSEGGLQFRHGCAQCW